MLAVFHKNLEMEDMIGKEVATTLLKSNLVIFSRDMHSL